MIVSHSGIKNISDSFLLPNSRLRKHTEAFEEGRWFLEPDIEIKVSQWVDNSS